MAEKMKKRKDGRYAKQVTIGMKNGKPVKSFTEKNKRIWIKITEIL
jgi:hypothetical protein